jgi:hypothetical protein
MSTDEQTKQDLADQTTQGVSSDTAQANGASAPVSLADQAVVHDAPENVAAAIGVAGDEDEVLEHLNESWWNPSSLIRGASSGLISLVVHLVVLIVLAFISLGGVVDTGLDTIVAEAEYEPPEELETVVLDTQTEAATELNFQAASSEAFGQADGGTPMVSEPVLSAPVVEESDGPSIALDTSLTQFPGSREGLAAVPEGAPGQGRAVVENDSTALDRITQEILWMLEKSKVLVVWCFDESESMKDDQKEIRDRIERVYKELGLSDKSAGDALLTAICSYGADFHAHTPKPTHDLDVIRKAIDAIPVDDSGKELMCTSLGRAMAAYRPFGQKGGRQLALILVTDESGEQEDNLQFLEPMIEEARAARCKIFVLGREAVFGYPYAHFHWVHPQTKRHHWLPVNRGPETAFVEQLQINGFRRRTDAYASGFGPYEQSRMAHQTGGIFFMLPSPESKLVRSEANRKYELDAMRGYQPDLRSRRVIVSDRDTSELRMTIWKVINDLNPYRKEVAEKIELLTHFSPDYQTFLKQAAQQHKKVPVFLEYLDRAYKTMQSGKMKRLRADEPDLRWRGNYDLIVAQLIAYKVRVYEYAAYLDHFAKNPQKVPLHKEPDLKLEYWGIRTRKEMFTEDVTGEFRDEAIELLKQCAKNHPGTPYAARAEWEINRGWGVELKPVYWHTWFKGDGPGEPTVPIPKL